MSLLLRCRPSFLTLSPASLPPFQHHSAILTLIPLHGLSHGPPPNPRSTILTHFSQRYPRVPTGIDPWAMPLARRPVTAFDGMVVPLAALPDLPYIMPPLAAALGEAAAAAGDGEAGQQGQEQGHGQGTQGEHAPHDGEWEGERRS